MIGGTKASCGLVLEFRMSMHRILVATLLGLSSPAMGAELQLERCNQKNIPQLEERLECLQRNIDRLSAELSKNYARYGDSVIIKSSANSACLKQVNELGMSAAFRACNPPGNPDYPRNKMLLQQAK
jgi:uncharacterized small protein (DUF1192 family)